MINELADNLLAHHNDALRILGNHASALYAAPAYPARVKKDVKNVLQVDESYFWDALLENHASMTAHIRECLALSRLTIKNTFKLMIGDKELQTILVRITTGLFFKYVKNGVLISNTCSLCNENLCIWEHFSFVMA